MARRIVITVIGSTVLLIGVIMIVMPGPAMVVIPAGLAILSLEFAWARRWLKKIRRKAEAVQAMLSERLAEYKQHGAGQDEHDRQKVEQKAIQAVLSEYEHRPQSLGLNKYEGWLQRVKKRTQAIQAALSGWFTSYKRTGQDERD